jgi:hypothetical protein
VDMVVTLGWPTVAVLGFLVLTGLVVVLGTRSTARYEFERNGAREQVRSGAPRYGAHPAGSRQRSRPAEAREAQALPGAVDLAVRPAPTGTSSGPGWWLVDDSALVVAGPFADRVDADWAALADDLPAIPVFGTRRADGGVSPKPSPEERAWLRELGEQLDRLPGEWDELLSDTDPLTTLVVEIAAALVEAGLSLYDAEHGDAAGGVWLVPDDGAHGVVVSWRAHDRMSLRHLRGAAAHATVQQSMNVALAEILENLGFVVEPTTATGTSLVTALR